jgi:hypothetical protein
VKGDVRKGLGSEGKREPLGAPDQEVAYSDGGAVKGWVEGGGVDVGWGSKGGLPSGGGLPSIAERMEYSRLAASEPKGKDGVSKAGLKRGLVGEKLSTTEGTLGGGACTGGDGSLLAVLIFRFLRSSDSRASGRLRLRIAQMIGMTNRVHHRRANTSHVCDDLRHRSQPCRA